MSMTAPVEQTEPPRGHVRVVYLGPVAPHWEVEAEFGERSVIEEFQGSGVGTPRAAAAARPAVPAQP